MRQKDFYEAMYAHEAISVQHSESPMAGRFARLWKRMELDREKAAFRFLDGGEKFLDVGCGQGNLVLLARQKFNEVYGIDIATPRIHRAQEKVKGITGAKTCFLEADLSQGIPFDNDFFDAVSCVVTLEYVFNPVYLIQEFSRVLRTRGSLIVVTANVAYIINRLHALLGKPPRASSVGGFMDGGALHYFTLSSLIALIEEAGFSVVKRGNVGKLWFLRNWWLSLLGSGLIIKAVKRAEINRTRLQSRR